MMLFDYNGSKYPTYIREGDACRHIAVTASHFCQGLGADVGAGKWPLPGAYPVELKDGQDAMKLPFEDGVLQYVFSSHCLEHLENPVEALEHWRDKLVDGGTLFLYLPHPDMTYWRPQFCRKHRHLFWPKDTAQMLWDLGFNNVIHSERDLYWSFSVVGFK